MNDTIRRLLIFIIILGTGTALIIFDLPLLFILVLESFIGFLLLVLLSPGFGAEIRRSTFDLLKISFIRKDNGKKTLFKIPVPKKNRTKKTGAALCHRKRESNSLSEKPEGFFILGAL